MLGSLSLGTSSIELMSDGVRYCGSMLVGCWLLGCNDDDSDTDSMDPIPSSSDITESERIIFWLNCNTGILQLAILLINFIKQGSSNTYHH